MAGKKKKKKQPSARSLIVSLIIEEGPRKMSGMTRILGFPYQSLNSEVLKLRKLGVLEKDADGVLSLVPGVDPTAFGIEVIISDPSALKSPQPETPRTIEEQFMDLLRSTGVKKGVETISAIYFSKLDFWNAEWLHHVLTDVAQGFVTEDQAKLIMGYWTIKNGIPYKHEDFFDD